MSSRRTITARPAGADRNGLPLGPRYYVIDRDPEPFSEGRSRVFAENRSFPKGDGAFIFTPCIVLTDTIRDAVAVSA